MPSPAEAAREDFEWQSQPEAAVHNLPDAEKNPAEIEQEIADSVDRLPVLERLDLWWSSPFPQMNEEDYEKARALYLRFLNNFLQIKTARFHVERYDTPNGIEEHMFSEDIIWSSSKFRVERANYKSGKDHTLIICSGSTVARYENGVQAYKGKTRTRGTPASYLFALETATITDRHPYCLNFYTKCEIDNGSNGYSRLWNPDGAEARFDTATGLLTENRYAQGRDTAYTYQNIGGIWFLKEEKYCFEDAQGDHRFRLAFSQVVLNEPVDERLFDVNNVR